MKLNSELLPPKPQSGAALSRSPGSEVGEVGGCGSGQPDTRKGFGLLDKGILKEVVEKGGQPVRTLLLTLEKLFGKGHG